MGIGFVPPMPYAFCARSDLFAPSVETKVVRGAQVAVIANHTRPWTPAAPTVGPPPSKLGLDPTPLPHAPPNDPGLLSAVQASKSIPRLIAPTEDPQSPGYLPPQVLPSQPQAPHPTPQPNATPHPPPGPTVRPPAIPRRAQGTTR